MKKLIALILVLVMCLTLVACGGPDRQPAIDAYNTMVDTYNTFVEIANADLSEWTDEDIDFFNSISEGISEFGAQLESEEELTQEELDEMVEMFDEFTAVMEEIIVEFGG